MRNIIILILAVTLMTGCVAHKNALGGAGLGGIAGGIIGSQIGGGMGRTVAIIAGTLLGAALGGYMGSYLDRMDKMDRRNLAHALENNPSGASTQWKNPDTGINYSTTPTRTYQDDDRLCRVFEIVIEDNGKTEKSSSTACREEGTTWEIVSLDNLG